MILAPLFDLTLLIQPWGTPCRTSNRRRQPSPNRFGSSPL